MPARGTSRAERVHPACNPGILGTGPIDAKPHPCPFEKNGGLMHAVTLAWEGDDSLRPARGRPMTRLTESAGARDGAGSATPGWLRTGTAGRFPERLRKL